MVRTLTVTWDLPTTRTSGNPLDPSEISGVDVSFSADGTNFTGLGLNTGGSVTIPDLIDGDWVVRLTVVDTEGRRSADVDVPVLIDTSAPGTVTNVNVTLS